MGSLQAAYSEDKGSRLTMEDVAVISHKAGTSTTAGCRLSFFAIFDGHGGASVARYAADHLHGCIMAAGLQQEAERLAAAAAAAATAPAAAAPAAAAGDSPGAAQPAAQIKQCRAALAEGFRELDRRVLEQCAAAGWQDGCTAVVAYVVGDAVLVANVGDARCVLARQPQAAAAAPQGEQGRWRAPLKAITLTREHKAIFPQERQRIEKAGSFVSGDGRLAGRIEVSRAFGDRPFKRQGMTAVPDIQAFQLSSRDAFLLLACDGFWGVFSPQDAVDYARRELGLGKGVKQTCNRLIYEAIRERKCKDNCTVMLVAFGC
ncbi:hypothetical protein CHLNCDRAFT_25388 [Chlorella variabilis]|uniref:protein-serine/threonine phosphatase n=1 Tax=Chlorella variabilis TaxID=554065 RepID=E1ZJL4_CHLVA|nr:hypothetical protein CHLNCDRAFT_25388 [Chlorella variabilis]EFN54009.1 hypothetical protein CHLNCDRAFT_25388 [Chlorella variabilis]|eukprot:XP_005846111.1 hypothetical protein CHLNCDRAFT_25388 [Chlorella variabilis]